MKQLCIEVRVILEQVTCEANICRSMCNKNFYRELTNLLNLEIINLLFRDKKINFLVALALKVSF